MAADAVAARTKLPLAAAIGLAIGAELAVTVEILPELAHQIARIIDTQFV